MLVQCSFHLATVHHSLHHIKLVSLCPQTIHFYLWYLICEELCVLSFTRISTVSTAITIQHQPDNIFHFMLFVIHNDYVSVETNSRLEPNKNKGEINIIACVLLTRLNMGLSFSLK